MNSSLNFEPKFNPEGVEDKGKQILHQPQQLDPHSNRLKAQGTTDKSVSGTCSFILRCNGIV